MANTADVSRLLRYVLADVGLPGDPVRESMRIWAHSSVERLRFPGRASVIFKYADAPFDREHLVLRLAARHGLPVPHVQAARTEAGVLAMLMDDLGKPVREANDYDGACAAARLHRLDGAGWLARVNTGWLATMPHRIGLCHSQYHPTSLHIGERGWHLLDFARAFNGPGLLDIASWSGTLNAPNPARTLGLIESYVEAGGHRQALAARGGLDAASWALGWHRVWVADLLTQQIERGWADRADDVWTSAITRHLTEAATLLHA